jgi:hypothetical protein
MSRLVVFWVSLLYSLLSLAAGLAAKILRFLAEIQFVCCLFRLWCDESSAAKTAFSGRIKTRLLRPGKPLLIRVANLPRP